jgi:hypothetical protein
MRIVRFSTAVIIAFLALYSEAQPQEPKITVTGELSRAMAIGGESTGWVIQFDAETTIDGKPATSIEIEYRKTRELEKLESKHVTAMGVLFHRQGVETGERIVLVVSSIEKTKAPAQHLAYAERLWPSREPATARASGLAVQQ